MNQKLYKAALYIRLSNDDDDKKIESNSVVNQKKLLTNYVNNTNNIEIYDYYVDDGYTGINFNRPAFQKMINDIKKYNINCVIVKDLSRLGRNYVDAGNYLDQFFPNNNIRFIAINDAIDKIGSDFDMIIPIKNIFNEQYSRDISKKVTSAFRVKQLSGEFIGAFASYGYKKDPNNKNKLIIDPYAAEIVKKVFDLYLAGNAKLKIAKILNKENILCPSIYKKQNGYKYTNGNRLDMTKYWTYCTIARMLQNEIYIGNMIQHKSVRSNFKNKKNKILDEDNWIRVENTHEAIIDKDTWNKVQKLLKQNTRQSNYNHNIHLFAGFVKCGDCGRAMDKINKRGKINLICDSYNKFGKSICTQHKISYSDLTEIVSIEIKDLIYNMLNIDDVLKNNENYWFTQKDNIEYKKQIDQLSQKLSKYLKLKKGIYEDFKEGILTKEEYIQYKNDYENEILECQKQIKLITENNTSINKIIESNWFKSFKKYKNFKTLDRNILITFIDKIFIFENKKIKIIFNCSDKIKKLNEIIK